MNTKTKRIGSITTSIVAVGLIVGGAYGVSAAIAQPGNAPAPTSTYVEPSVDVDKAIAEAEAKKAEEARIAAEAEAARVEAERVAAEAAAAEAARVAAEQAAADEAARQAASQNAPAAPSAPVVVAPAPPAPPAPGDQQAGECREYNDANECTAYYVP